MSVIVASDEQPVLAPIDFMFSKLHDGLKKTLYTLPRRDVYCAVFFAASATVLHLYWSTVVVLKPVEREVLFSPFIPRLFVLIGVCLILSMVGLCMLRPLGLMFSMFGLLGVAAGYLLWFIYSLHIMRLLAADPLYKAHPEAAPLHSFGLIGAEWWNLVVLVIVAALLFWEIKALINGIRLSRKTT